MDRNQIIGLVLISVLILVYLQWFSPKEPIKTNPPQTTAADSAKKDNVNPAPVVVAVDSSMSDSARTEKYKKMFGAFAKNAEGEAKDIVLENKDIKVVLSSKGADIKSVLLKNYLTYEKEKLFLIDEESSKMSFIFPTKNGDIDINKLYFTTSSQSVSVAKGDSGRVAFRLELEPGKFIEKTYALGEKGFELNTSIKTAGLENILTNQDVKFSWTDDVKRVERDLTPTRTSTTVNLYTQKGEFEHIKESALDPEEQKIAEPVKWVAMKQRFFTAAIIANESFGGAAIKSSIADKDDSSRIKDLKADLTIPSASFKDGKADFKFFFGPNNYQVLKKVTDGFGSNVYLGWAVFATINKFLVVPIFNFLQQYIGNYGLIILILVLIIKLILFPLSYKSHISLAKTKVLKPELDEIKAKYPDDMQKQQAEQMQLYSKVGVNPLSGCIPVLLQMPIFFALFNFFPNSVELRQEAFLWADDLSTYDSIVSLPFSFLDHISLFCVLMTISTLIYTWFNNQVSTVTGPMKSMQYLMPLIFLFALNSFAAGLTYYYFVNNVLTIGQQLAFRSFVDEKKIRKTLEENKTKNKDKKKSKFASRLEEAMKSAEVAKKKK